MYLLILLDFNDSWIFLTDFFFLNTQISYLMEIHPVGAELFRADGQTWQSQSLLFCNFVNMPKNTGKTWYKDYWFCDWEHVISTGLSGWWMNDVATALCTVELGYNKMKGLYVLCHYKLTHSQALQPMQGLGWLKKSPPAISILGLALPISDSQPLCIPHHSIHPSKVWPSHSPSALRLVQGDFLTW